MDEMNSKALEAAISAWRTQPIDTSVEAVLSEAIRAYLDASGLTSKLAALEDENKTLRDIATAIFAAIDAGRLVERGAGGMTIESQMKRSVYNGVPAWPIEENREAFAALSKPAALPAEGKGERGEAEPVAFVSRKGNSVGSLAWSTYGYHADLPDGTRLYATPPAPQPVGDDEAYEIGKRDGYEEAIQDLDLATGGDGEFKGSSFVEDTVDVPVMKQRIIDRLTAPQPVGEVTAFMVDAAWNEGKNRRMSGLPSDFRAVLEAALDTLGSASPSPAAQEDGE